MEDQVEVLVRSPGSCIGPSMRLSRRGPVDRRHIGAGGTRSASTSWVIGRPERCPRCRIVRASLLPRNPAPPVISTFIVFRVPSLSGPVLSASGLRRGFPMRKSIVSLAKTSSPPSAGQGSIWHRLPAWRSRQKMRSIPSKMPSREGKRGLEGSGTRPAGDSLELRSSADDPPDSSGVSRTSARRGRRSLPCLRAHATY